MRCSQPELDVWRFVTMANRAKPSTSRRLGQETLAGHPSDLRERELCRGLLFLYSARRSFTNCGRLPIPASHREAKSQRLFTGARATSVRSLKTEIFTWE